MFISSEGGTEFTIAMAVSVLTMIIPSGCGKSTLLRMIAGLENITKGDLIMGGKRINEIPSGQRNVAMVFQNYALYPHMSVEENIKYGLKVHKIGRAEIDKRYKKAIELLKLEGLENRKPRELSGGQRQRVALARAIVKRADYFLLDEPLSNLDVQLRASARKGLVELHNIFQQTYVYVTHDQTEAMTIGNRIALFNKGKLQMLATPEEVYKRLKNVFTANFIGSPPMNIIKGKYESGNIWFDKINYNLRDDWCKFISEKSSSNMVYIGIRPEDIALAAAKDRFSVKGTIKYIENYGNKKGIYIDVGKTEIIALADNMKYECGSQINVIFSPEKIHVFDGQTLNSLGYPDSIDGLEGQI